MFCWLTFSFFQSLLNGWQLLAICTIATGCNYIRDDMGIAFIISFTDLYLVAYPPKREWFSPLLDAQVVIEDRRLHYNTQRPHSSLKYKTPTDFAAQLTTQIQPAQSLIPVGHNN